MRDLPPALAAALEEIHQCLRRPAPCPWCERALRSVMAAGAAAERERIAELAERFNAVCFTDLTSEGRSFADEIRREAADARP
jgi:hypothetical protein